MTTEALSHCPSCESQRLSWFHKEDRFEYGVGPRAVELTARFPVQVCKDCGFEYVGEEGMIARDNAVREHLGILKPQEIVAIRTSLGMSQRRFAEISKIGIASLARWESGSQCQNNALDFYVRLLQFTENVQRVLSWAGGVGKAAGTTSGHRTPKFQCLKGGALVTEMRRADLFRLSA